MTLTADEVYRDYATNGVPSSGAHKPNKREIRKLLTGYESVIDAVFATGGKVYSTWDELRVDLTPDANTMAWVIRDTDVYDNGIYRKVGGSGSGSWTRLADLPMPLITATDTGDGSADAIVATSSLPVTTSSIVRLSIASTNTGSPVTVAFNGNSPVPIKTISGGDVPPSGLVGGSTILGFLSGDGTFRLLSDLASASIISEAESLLDDTETARDATFDARDIAIAAADQAAVEGAGDVPTSATRALAQVATIPSARSYLIVSGFAAIGDGGQALYKKAVSEPGHAGKFQSGDGAWWEIAETRVAPQMLGYTTGDVAAYVGDALDVADYIFFPEKSDGYDFETDVTKTLTSDKVIDFNGQLVRFDDATLWLKGETVATGLLPQTFHLRYSTDWIISDSAGIAPGDLLYVNTTVAPSTDWSDTKKDVVRIAGVDAGTDTLTLDQGINFRYDTSDAGITCDIYRPHKVTLLRPNLEMMSDATPQIMIHLEALHDVEIVSPTIKGQMPFDRASNIYRVGIQLWKCWQWTVTNAYYKAMSYPIGVYGGTRLGAETNTRARYCHHSHADLGDWASDYRLIGLDDSDSFQALNRHPSFRCFAENFNVRKNTGLSNWRGFGGGWSNGYIQSAATDADELAQFQSDAVAAGYEYMYEDADAYFDNVVFDIPGRVVKPALEVRKGRNVTFSRLTIPSIGASASPANMIENLIFGPGNRIGDLKAPAGINAGNYVRNQVRVHVPPLLAANKVSSVYHIDPHAYIVDQSGGFLKCYGPIESGLPGDSGATVRIHLNAFAGTDQATVIVGVVKLFATLIHQNSGFFSTIEKHYNFAFENGGTGVVMPTTPVYTSGLSGQANESVTLSLSSITGAHGADAYIQFAATIGAGGRDSPIVSLDYELTLRLCQ
ncbi:hypothetical protein [Nitrobacter sp. TKz-YC01]|uniref:hypothetical protein n=1 Tax=Nitrobacter sp. TKz-YC01 TaxID=3398703 RepID=UPI003A102300